MAVLLPYSLKENGGYDDLRKVSNLYSQLKSLEFTIIQIQRSRILLPWNVCWALADTAGELESSDGRSSAVSLLALIPSGARHGFQYVVTHANGTLITWRADGLFHVSCTLL